MGNIILDLVKRKQMDFKLKGGAAPYGHLHLVFFLYFKCVEFARSICIKKRASSIHSVWMITLLFSVHTPYKTHCSFTRIYCSLWSR